MVRKMGLQTPQDEPEIEAARKFGMGDPGIELKDNSWAVSSSELQTAMPGEKVAHGGSEEAA